MRITAQIENARGKHEVVLTTDGDRHTISIPPKESGAGSKANGGELLFLALATCVLLRDRAAVFLEEDLRRRGWAHHLRQPAQVGGGPPMGILDAAGC